MRKLIVPIFLATFFLCMCRANAKESAGTKVNVVLNWKEGPQHTEFVVAVYKGFFAKEGLDVTLHSPASPPDSIKLAASGEDDFGVTNAGDALQAIDKGVPIKAIAALHRRNTLGLVSRPEDKILHPQDVVGKTVGLDLQPIVRAMFFDFLLRNRIKADAVKVVNIGYDCVPLLLAKKLDLCDSVSWYEPPQYKEITGHWPDNMIFTDYRVPDGYYLTIIASKKILAEQPETTKRFLKAVFRAERWTLLHPDEARKLLLSRVPEVGPVFAKGCRMVLDKIIVDKDTASHGLGWQSSRVWSTMAKWYFDQHFVTRVLAPKDLFTNEYLPNPPVK